MTTQLPHGSTEVCLDDFFSRYQEEEAHAVLTNFIGVRAHVIQTWQTKAHTPQGENLIRTRVFLDLLGYHLDEFDTLPQVTRQFAQILAFRLMDMEAARAALTYNRVAMMYEVILRGRAMLARRIHALERIVDDYEKDLVDVVAQFKQVLDAIPLRDGSNSNGTPTVFPPADLSTPVVEMPHPAEGEDIVVRVNANSIGTSIALLDWLGTFSNADELRLALLHAIGRDRLRSLVGSLLSVLG